MRRVFTLAAGLCLALAPLSASAGGKEGRGYGGALNVGPNFEKGGQFEPPDYGSSKPAKQRATSKQTKSNPSAKKSKATKAAAKPSTSESPDEAESAAASGGSSGPVPANDAVSDTSPQSDTASTTVATPKGPVTCKRFDANSGQTITVPCD